MRGVQEKKQNTAFFTKKDKIMYEIDRFSSFHKEIKCKKGHPHQPAARL